MILYKLFRQIVILLIGLLLFPTMLSAQSEWVDNGKEKTHISIEIIKPFVAKDTMFKQTDQSEAGSGLTTLSGVAFLSGKYAIGKNFALAADLSIAHQEWEDDDLGAQTILGNPYIGAEYYLTETPLFFELGFRIPIVQDAVGSSILSDIDRSEAFIHDVFPVYVAMNYNTITKSNILFRARTGANLWFFTQEPEEGVSRRNPHVSVDYTLQTGYDHPRLNIIVGATGRLGVSSNSQIQDKLHFLQYGATITVPFGNFRPGINFRIPGNSATEKIIDYVVGVNLAYSFK